MVDSLFINAWSIWAPGFNGKETIAAAAEKPPLDHVDSMFKRRLSQLTRMTIHVGHEVLIGQPPMKITFASMYGEINQQYKITERLLDSGDVSPANFSLSVFNTPVAALSITEKNTEGYTAVYPGPDAFVFGLMESFSAILSGLEKNRLFIIADELIPEVYDGLYTGVTIPYALALVLSLEKKASSISVPADVYEKYRLTDSGYKESPPALAFAQDLRDGLYD